MKKVFIDGGAGTTGLRIVERLSKRSDVTLIKLPEELRKDSAARKKALNECDIAFLCLPDAAAIESVEMIENENVVVLDTSTAHRTNDAWAYGFPELSKEHFEKVASAKRIAVPGCHASGFIALAYPLIEKGILGKDALLTCHSITGYSGGGKNMIAQYEDSERENLLDAPRQYALAQKHKHLPEMSKITGLENAPIFCPIVSDFYSGMVVTIPVFKSQLEDGFGIEDIKNAYREKYTDKIVKYVEDISEEGLISANTLSFKDSMQITVEGNEDRILLIARYDNLGKGASGAALECMNIVMGEEPSAMLDII